MLKSLELIGFKSFADRDRFEFSSGITAIVGPNGSGKSNVVDAIKWILGAQSAKSLRGREMTDVIFGGTQGPAGRKPAAFAEASLTFDNSAALLDMESAEVVVGRRLWRNGDSEYLINGTPRRLKDIRNLFLGTGAGAAAYCIIEQGRVDQILQASSTNRRLVFEDAAGISRYKARKDEALRRLERIDQNLLRLSDIVDEVESQLTSVRGQAVKATKYRDLSSELRELWLGLAADDFRRSSNQKQRIQEQLDQIDTELKSLGRELSEQGQHVAAVEHDIAAVDDRLREVERQRTSVRERVAGHQATIRHQTDRGGELIAERDRLRGQRRLLLRRVREVLDERRHNKDVLDHGEREFARYREALAGREKQIAELDTRLSRQREEIDESRERLLEQMRFVSDADARTKALEAERRSLEHEQTALREQLGKADEQIEQQHATCTQHEQELRTSAERLRKADETVRAIRAQIESLLNEQGRFRQTLADLREQRGAARARQSVLEDLESRQEGLAIGVREILQRAQTSSHSPWNRIAGSVADLLQVDLEQAALLEVALGTRSQLIVVDDFAPLIDYLNSGTGQISERVGFVSCLPDDSATGHPTDDHPLSRFAVDPQSVCDLSNCAGVIERADRFVRSSDRFSHLAERLLADTWIVETLDVAMDLSAGPGRGCRFVTLQGELLDADGVLTVGTVRSETALVSRRSELRQLKTLLRDLDRRVSEEEHRLAELDESFAGLQSALREAESELQELDDRHTELKAEQSSRTKHLERLRDERENSSARIEQIEERDRQRAAALREAEMSLAQKEEDLRTLTAQIDQRERDVARDEHRVQTLRRRSADEQLDLARREEHLNSLRDSFERIERDLGQRRQQQEEADRRLQRTSDQIRGADLHILNTRAAIAELALTQQQLAETVQKLTAEKQMLRQRRTAAVARSTDLRDRQNKLNEARHQAEIAGRDIKHRLASLGQQIEDEYQIDLADVARSGVSAYRRYCEQLSPDENNPPPAFDDVRDEIETQVNRLKRRLKVMGSVNTDSLENLDELEQRFGQLSTQLEDLTEAKNALEEIIQRINSESARRFTETFDSIRGHFRELFRRAFGGGDGDIVLEDPDDVLECGIDVIARPPGKELKSISLMSGGEKTLTAFALLLAMFKSRPSPYCILDEVDAALDEANIERLIALLKEFKENTQFVIITHRKPTMTIADVLHGVTMEEPGVSKRISVRFEDVSENGEFNASASSRRESSGATHPGDAAA